MWKTEMDIVLESGTREFSYSIADDHSSSLAELFEKTKGMDVTESIRSLEAFHWS